MSGDAWLTLGVVVATLVVLVSERVAPAAAVVGATTFLLLAGVIDAEQAFSGFSNPAPITVAALYVLAGAVEITGALGWLTRRTLPSLGRDPTDRATRGEMARFLPAPLGLSAFLNNTTVVAMLAPRVLLWSRQAGRPASGFLMPLSFAALLGGLITAIGTSTNLVVSGLLTERGMDALGLFEITKVGLPVAVVGLVLLVVLAPRLLPVRPPAPLAATGGAREFTVEMIVGSGSPLVGRTVAEAGLRNLQGVYLVEVERRDHRIAPVAPSEVLEEDDRLVFAGNVGNVLDLQRLPGLVAAERRHFSVVGDARGHTFYEMVVGAGSSLVGRTLKEVGFRNDYRAAVVAIHRAGEQVAGKLGSVRLRAGDVLLALADEGLRERLRDHHDFLVVARLDGEPPLRQEKARLVEITLLGLLVVVGFGWLDILEGGLLAAFALLGMGVLSVTEARRAVDLEVLVLIAASFGLGAAVGESGLAETLAESLVDGFGSFGDLGVLAGVLVGTMLLTEVITNNAAAVLMFPIAVAVATQAGLDPRPFAIAVAVGASADFLTPIGYQTNTMVYGMGGYRFGDFARLGTPLTLAVVAVSLVVIPWAFPL